MTAWLLFLVLLPFREGSGSPEGLLIAHLVFLLAAAASVPSARRLSPALALAVAAALASAGLSGLVGNYRFASLIAFFDLAVFLGVLVFLEATVRSRPQAAEPLLLAVALSGGAQALLILSAWVGSGLRAPSPGTLLNPDHAAAYLISGFWAVVALGEAGFFRGLSRQVVLGVLLLGAATVQASRGALLGLLAGGGIYLGYRIRSMTRRARLLAASAAVAVVVLGGSSLVQRFVTHEDPFRWERLRLWVVALKVAEQDPLLGVGPGVFAHSTAPFEIARREAPVRYAKHVEATHSDYFRVLAETGALGSVAFLLLAVVIGRRSLAAIRSGGGIETALGAGLGCLLVQMSVENLSARPAVSYTGAAFAAILLGRATSAPERRDRRGSKEPSHLPLRPVGRYLVYAGISWAAFVFVLAPYLGHRAFSLFQQGGPEAGRQYRAALFWNPIHPDYRAAVARAALAAKTTNAAVLRAGFLAVQEAISLKPMDPAYPLLRARLARQAFLSGGGEADWIEIADDAYQKAARLDPLRPQARVERGSMLLSVGRAAAALEAAETALTFEPNCFEGKRLKVAALLELGRRKEARAEMESAHERRSALSAFIPSDDYEAAVIRWDDEGWRALEARLQEQIG